MVLFALAALGLGIGYGLWGPDWGLVDWLAANSDYILYLLMFSVGISVGMHHGLWNKLKQYHIKILVVPAGIVVGSMLGGILCGLLTGHPLNESAAAACGLGWYSLGEHLLFQQCLAIQAFECLQLHCCCRRHQRRYDFAYDDPLYQ